MIATRLIQLIEDHSEEIVRRVLERVRQDPRLPEFQKLPDSELQRRFADVCQRLSVWLALKDEQLIEHRFANLGRERFEEGIPLHEVVHVAHLFKRGLLGYAREQHLNRTAFEIYAEGELEHLIGGFFDRLVYYLAQGYEEALRESLVSQLN